MISQRGIEANPEKSKAIIDMETPKTQKDIQSLIGRVAALTRFISKATDKCVPFFKALKGGKHQIAWTPECDQAFQNLKNYMSKAPLLSKPLPGEVLLLYLSVSVTAVSSVLIRKPEKAELPIFYVSKALQSAELRPAEKGQVVADFISELTLPVPPEPSITKPTPQVTENVSTEHFDPSVPVWILHVDGSANQQGCGAGLAYEIRQIPQSENSHADALSRLASAINDKIGRKVPVEILSQPSTTTTEVCTVRYENTWMSPIYAFLIDGTLPTDKSQARKLRYRSARYTVINDVLYKRGYTTPYLKCLTKEKGDYILREVHSGVCGDHSGSRSLAHKVFRQGYFWPTLHQDANVLVKKCDKCQRFGSIPHIPAEPLSPIVSPWPFAQWGLDLIGPMPEGKGQVKYAVVAVDYFTKWVEAKALATITAARVEDFLPEALWAIRTSYRTATGETPFSMAFGSEAVVPVEIGEPSYRTETFTPEANEEALSLSLDLIEEHRAQANLQNEGYKQRVSRYYDSRVRSRSFRIGDWVMRKVSLATKNPTEGTL
ncbi:unnamed protein product, partial [Prunus brigantina]